MMNLPLDEVVTFNCTTRNWLTGQVSNADSAPTIDIYEDNEAAPAANRAGITMTQRTATGCYYASDIINDTDYDVGKWYSVQANATVNGVTDEAVIFRFRVVAAENTEGYPVIDVGLWIGTAVTLSTNDKPDVNVTEWNDVLLATTNPLPNVAPDADGGLPTGDASGRIDVGSWIGTAVQLQGSLPRVEANRYL